METQVLELEMHDETATGKVLNNIVVRIKERSTAKDIIVARVNKEVEEYNRKGSEYFNGLVQPVDAEKTLNGYKLKKKKVIDAEKQAYIALDSFQKNGFFILVDKQQLTTLDEEITLTKNSAISFIKLTPLVGG